MSDSYVLGINVSHDISCALLKDGVVICGIAEERLNRIKRYTGGIDHEGMTNKHLPHKSIQYCLDAASIKLTDVNLIVVSSCVVVNYKDFRIRQLTKEEILDQLPSNIDANKVIIVGHHLGHAASAFYPSNFDESAIIVVDGGGSLITVSNSGVKEDGQYEERVTIYKGNKNTIDVIKQYTDGAPTDGYLSNQRHCSLGDFYQSSTVFVGFKGGDEGKTMGLAPYGSDHYFKDFLSAIEFKKGVLSIDTNFQFNKWAKKSDKVYGGRFGSPRTYNGNPREEDKNIAAATQYALEETLIKIANQAYEQTGSKNLCLAGGVALNSVANKKILDRTSFENIFVQPASGDDGCALGNALIGWTDILKNPRRWQMNAAYTGRGYSKAEIQNAINKYKLWCVPIQADNILKKTSEFLSQKSIVGWFQGGSEFGPRALGHRSILSDARFPEMKDILNAKVKHREGFRPFAPSILEDHCSEYFDLNCPSPYMLLIANVKNPDAIPAVTHVDKTARVQTVNKKDNGIYFDLINEYYKLTGTPVLLNTSFNVAGEPIVETPENAIRCFLCTQIDYLVLEGIILRKHPLRCFLFKILPQNIKRVSIMKLKQLSQRFPALSRLKKILTSSPNQAKNVKVPG